MTRHGTGGRCRDDVESVNASGGTSGKGVIPEIRKDVARGNRGFSSFFLLKCPLLLGAVNLAQIIDTSGRLLLHAGGCFQLLGLGQSLGGAAPRCLGLGLSGLNWPFSFMNTMVCF